MTLHRPNTLCRFHRILLSWDYYALCKRAEEGKGVYDTLRSVPNTFASIQVRRPAVNCSCMPRAADAGVVCTRSIWRLQ